MKLTKKKVKYIVRWKERGKRSKEIAMELKISKRRVDQIWKEYRERGEISLYHSTIVLRLQKKISSEESLEAKFGFAVRLFGW